MGTRLLTLDQLERAVQAILFGSIGTLADTSEIQRRAFNDVFAEAGLNWHWDRASYKGMLASSGGENRIASFALTTGADIDAAKLHRAKAARFVEMLAQSRVEPRPGVVDVVREARAGGQRLGFITTTTRETVDAIISAIAPHIDHDDFDLITDVTSVRQPKPAPDVYRHACDSLGLAPAECVAIEDNLGGVTAAGAAGVPRVAFPNENTRNHDFGGVTAVEALSMDVLGARRPGS